VSGTTVPEIVPEIRNNHDVLTTRGGKLEAGNCRRAVWLSPAQSILMQFIGDAMRRLAFLVLILGTLAVPSMAFPVVPQCDTVASTDGDLVFTFIGHGTLMMQAGRTTIHVDPVGQFADYATMPKADIILITHHHGDHFDADAVDRIRKKGTVVLLSARCGQDVVGGKVMANGETVEILKIKFEAVPAYNLLHHTDGGAPYHPRGEGNGYIVTVGKTRVYIAGDTENTPEMKALKGIDVAFLPMNLPYTMAPAMVADAAKAFRPKILYPYHFGKTNVNELLNLMKGEKGIEVRVRKME
jgi:L-ascorbate metabolism protein UlaG (beta-lactamase superfamily)